MSIYSTIYNNLCHKRCQLKESWKRGSNLHRHHIIPRHSNGTDDEDNFTYLTIREHILAHFLLWKIYKNPNDLRAMHMLGAKLTFEQRRTIGKFCYENNIGIFGSSDEDKSRWRRAGIETQKNKQIGIFNLETRSAYASLGGKVGGKRQAELGIGGHHPNVLAKCRRAGGLSHIGKKWINKDGITTRASGEKLDRMLVEGWKLGTGRPAHNKRH